MISSRTSNPSGPNELSIDVNMRDIMGFGLPLIGTIIIPATIIRPAVVIWSAAIIVAGGIAVAIVVIIITSLLSGNRSGHRSDRKPHER